MLDVKENFKNRYAGEGTQLLCALGCDMQDSQEHLLSCMKLQSNCLLLEKDQPKYSDLFSENGEKQAKIALILQEKLEKRKIILQEMDRGEPLSVFSST